MDTEQNGVEVDLSEAGVTVDLPEGVGVLTDREKAAVETSKTISTLLQSPYQFHLTGSRAFGFDTPDSDWDFFVFNPPNMGGSLNVINVLKYQGFIEDGDSTYQRCYVLKKGKVHVQVVLWEPDYLAKFATHHLLKQFQFRGLMPIFEKGKLLDEQQIKDLWSLIGELYQSGMAAGKREATNKTPCVDEDGEEICQECGRSIS